MNDIEQLFVNRPPYSAEDMKAKTFKVKFRVRGMGWVEVETNTQFFANGLLDQAAKLIAEGQFKKCRPPKKGEHFVNIALR